MCGRFSLIVDIQAVARRFGIVHAELPWKPRYNLAPTQTALVISESRKLEAMRFGLVPHWSKSEKSDFPMINARAETLREKPSFKALLKSHRCLIPADGFYEWQRSGTTKQPLRIVRRDRGLFAFAGLYDLWQKEDQIIRSFTIITTEANALIRPIHERMPVILTAESEKLWLDPSIEDPEKLLIAYPHDDLEIYPVSKLVNSWKIDSPDCIAESH
jgi:putative SOS response-associated peptidase YedK